MVTTQPRPRVKFGDVVQLNRDRYANPLEEGIERYVGLEHIEPEDLRIRRWGTVADGTTFTNLFRPGQVLFGKRRAYQRKVAVADFTGVCSGDIYVFESKDPSVLLPELLPFVCQTDGFFDHAVGTSAGSLSPRTNWTQLAQYEFALPPLDEQRRIAEGLLWAESNIDQLHLAAKSSLVLIDSVAQYIFTSLFACRHTPKILLSDLLQTPVCNGIFRKKSEFGAGLPLVNVTDIYASFRVDANSLALVPVTDAEYERFSAKPHDVIFNRSSLVVSGIGHACLVPVSTPKLVFECHLMRARPNPDKLYGPYLARYALSPHGRRHFLSHAQTTTMTTISQDDLTSMVVPCPSLDRQREISARFDAIEAAHKVLVRRMSDTRAVKKVLMGQIDSLVM